MALWTFGILGALVALWAGYTHFYEGNLGQPAYSVTSDQNGIEYRRYEPFVIASTQMDNKGAQALTVGFAFWPATSSVAISREKRWL